MGRPKTKPEMSDILAAGRKPVEPEDENQEQPESEPAPAFHLEQPNGRTSKADAVRAALAEGLDAPGDIADFIKTRFGIEMGKQMISSYKAQQKAREARANGETPTRRQPQTAAAAIPTDFPADIKEVRKLIDEAGGAEKLKQLSDRLGKLLSKYGQTGLGDLIEAFA